jgi:hypothetical protein
MAATASAATTKVPPHQKLPAQHAQLLGQLIHNTHTIWYVYGKHKRSEKMRSHLSTVY